MIRDLSVQCEGEETDLAPFAVKNSESAGRRWPEVSHPFRTDFQRDRDRVLHSRAFRRLEYKTQVFLSGSGDHLRTRLTHTIEVAAIARTIARSLRLNEDLAETISLAHDIGHTPFGHAGERALQKIMAEYGGFDHNLQALRIVDCLEIKYPHYDGLNLSWEVRAGLIKHREETPELDGKKLPPHPSLEAQVADLADDLTYYGHDADDGLDSGLITVEMLEELELWRLASEKARAAGLVEKDERYAAYTIRCLIDMMVGNAIRYSNDLLVAAAPDSSSAARNCKSKLISFSPDFEPLTLELRNFLYHNLYFHPEINKLNEGSLEKMTLLFDTYRTNPELLGKKAQARIAVDGLPRAIADYIAGMTDVFAFKEYDRFAGEKHGDSFGRRFPPAGGNGTKS